MAFLNQSHDPVTISPVSHVELVHKVTWCGQSELPEGHAIREVVHTVAKLLPFHEADEESMAADDILLTFTVFAPTVRSAEFPFYTHPSKQAR